MYVCTTEPVAQQLQASLWPAQYYVMLQAESCKPLKHHAGAKIKTNTNSSAAHLHGVASCHQPMLALL